MKATRRTPRITPLKAPGPSFATDKVTPVKEFLETHYRIEVNKYDPTQMRISSTGTRVYRFQPTLNDISLHMMQEGIPHSKTLLGMLLGSQNHTATFDPVKEYFESLRDIEPGESHIDRLLEHLHVREFGDRPQGYYKEMAARFIRKWLAAAAACATGRDPNEAALVFVGETEGTGKSLLAQFLCPKPLQEMMIKSEKDGRKFDMVQVMTNNFFVLYDEMDGLSARTAETFKKVMSSRTLPVRYKGEFSAIPRQRIASVIATTNNRTGAKYGFLCPALGTRRFISIYLDKIDYEGYQQRVDVDRLWAEALQLSENPDFEYRYTQEDFAELYELNQRYMMETPTSVILQQVFTVPEEGDDQAQWMNATEIVAELERRRLIRSDLRKYFSINQIGVAMTSLSFRREMIYDSDLGSGRYRYHVRFI